MKSIIKEYSREYLFLSIAGIIILFYILPYLVLGQDANLLIHDNLDSGFALQKVLVETKSLFISNSTIVEPVIGGVPRSSFSSEFNIMLFWLWLFNPIWAYIINRVIIILIAFIGMYLLLSKHIIPGKENNIIHVGVALTFSLLPFWPLGGLSISGIPLVIYFFLNIRSGYTKWYSWLIIILFPFYSSLVLIGFFLLFSLFLLWLGDLIIQKQFKSLFLVGLVILSSLYVLSEYRLFAILLDQSFDSHRIEFVSGVIGLRRALNNTVSMFLYGQYHAHSLHRIIVLPTVMFSLFILIELKDRFKSKIYMFLIIYILIASLLYGFYYYYGVQTIKEFIFNLIPMNFNRFHFLHPVFWMVLFGLSLSLFNKKLKYGKLFVICIVGLQIIYSFANHEIYINRRTPTFKEFYAEDQFTEISNYIGLPKESYRVASLGLHPAVSLYNGFATIDGYLSNYPIEYKHQFRKIISGELDKNENLKNYYDGWGSRIYLYSDELGQLGSEYINFSGNNIEIQRLEYDWQTFLNLGGKYILSAVKINEELNPEVNFERAFFDSTSAWDIYLYSVK